jgi:hypothetical protein
VARPWEQTDHHQFKLILRGIVQVPERPEAFTIKPQLLAVLASWIPAIHQLLKEKTDFASSCSVCRVQKPAVNEDAPNRISCVLYWQANARGLQPWRRGLHCLKANPVIAINAGLLRMK